MRGDDAFDLTIRESEAQKQSTNITRRPPILAAPLAHGDLHDGQRLYLLPRALYAEEQGTFDAVSPLFQVVLDASGQSVRFRWKASDHDPEQLLPPSAVWHAIVDTVSPDRYDNCYWPVRNSYSISPEGESLGAFAERTGAWETSAD